MGNVGFVFSGAMLAWGQEVIIKQDNGERFRFAERGLMIGFLGYNHLIFDVNLTYIEDAIVSLCSHTELVLGHLEPHVDQGSRKIVDHVRKNEDLRCHILTDDYLNALSLLSAAPEGEGFLLGHVPFAHLKESMGRVLNHKKFQLHDAYNFPEDTGLSTNHSLVQRQLVVGAIVLVGIVAIGTIWFSHSELARLSVQVDRDANLFAVHKLQETEVRSFVNRKALEAIEDNLNVLGQAVQRLELSEALTRLSLTNDRIETSIRRMIQNMEQTATLQLSPGFFKAHQMEKKLAEVQKKLDPMNYRLAVNNLRDALRSPSSYVLFQTGKLRKQLEQLLSSN